MLYLAQRFVVLLNGTTRRGCGWSLSLILLRSPSLRRAHMRPYREVVRAHRVLTTSGELTNLNCVLQVARTELDVTTVGLLGGTGAPASRWCDHTLLVPDGETARVQETHLVIGHVILELLEDRLVAAYAADNKATDPLS